MGQHRCTQRQSGKVEVVDLEEAKLRREGWTVNHKRVYRPWRQEGLQRPTPRRQKRARPADGSSA